MLNQETEFRILATLLPAIKPTFIDVGAEKGTFSRWLLERGFSGTAIEPLPKHAASLQALADGSSFCFLSCGVDAEDGERDLHIATDDAGQALDYFHSLQPLHGDQRVHHTRRERILCRSLGSLVRAGMLPEQIGLLKIDTEGNDLRVLQGSPPLCAEVLVVEYFTEGLYAGWTDAAPGKLIAQAEDQGFTHCIAIRRRTNGLEWITCQPVSFLPGEWGNLIFTSASHYAAARPGLAALVTEAESATLRRIEELQHACEERLKLIQQLHEACAALRSSPTPS